MIIAKVMKMIIIFMLIIAVIPEHCIMPFVPLCEKLKMNFPPPCTMETRELVPNFTPPLRGEGHVRHR